MTADPQGVLSELDRLRNVARGDRRRSSVPLLVFGALTVVSAVLPVSGMLGWQQLYWAVAGPAGFLLVGWWYRQRRLRTGGGPGGGSYAKTGLIVAGLFVLPPFWFLQGPVIAAALFVHAIRQRNTYLAVFTVIFGMIAGLEAFAVFDNLMYRFFAAVGMFRAGNGYFAAAPRVVYAFLGLVLLGGGLVAHWREQRSSRG